MTCLRTWAINKNSLSTTTPAQPGVGLKLFLLDIMIYCYLVLLNGRALTLHLHVNMICNGMKYVT